MNLLHFSLDKEAKSEVASDEDKEGDDDAVDVDDTSSSHPLLFAVHQLTPPVPYIPSKGAKAEATNLEMKNCWTDDGKGE